MMKIGIQTKNIIYDDNPYAGFELIKKAGFDCVDFSLNEYLRNKDLYNEKKNTFFDKSEAELMDYFSSHKMAADEMGVAIHQMHMPYPVFVPGTNDVLNTYLAKEMAPKSLCICKAFGCRYIVIHGAKLVQYYGSEEAEWEKTKEFLEGLAPLAKKMGITMCIENLYSGKGDHIVEGPCCNAYKAARRIDEMNEKFGAEVLGFCLDTGHANLVGIDLYKFITILGKRLKVLHVHDNDGERDLHQIPFTFTKSRDNKSSTDWEGFAKGLAEIGFDGSISFETGPVLTAFPEEMKEQCLGFINNIGKYFVKEIEKNKQ